MADPGGAGETRRAVHRAASDGYRSRMAESNRNRRIALFLVVVGILAVLGVMVLIGALEGDETDIDPQNGQLVTLVR
jgi:hypothetical protein